MADNLILDEGTSAKSARTDEISANLHVPYVKLMDGTADGTGVALVDANGLEVQGAGTAGTPAGGVVSVQGVGSGTTLPVTEASASSILTSVQLIDDAVYADDADWTDSTSKHVLVGGLYQSTPQTITDGDVGPLQTDSTGKLLIGNASIAGTAGTPNAGVLSVQGITSGTTLGVTEANSNAIKTAVELIDNAISGSEMQVDVVTQPARTVGSMIDWSHYSNEYTTTQTSTDLVALSGSTKFYIGRLTIGTGGTTAGLVTIYFGTGAYSAGTSKTVFRGNFAPAATTYPGVVIGNGAAPFIVSAAGDALKITTSAAMTVYVQVDYIRV
jgi:hypothetical protein